MNAPKTLQEAIQFFSEEQVSIDAVAAMRWLNGPICPECGAREPYYIKTQKRWKCRDCRRQFSVKVGTIFEDSPISLCKWLPALWLLCNCKNGVSSWEIHRDLGVSQKTAWFMLHRLRLALQDKSTFQLPNNGGPIQVDETFIGGKARNMHKSRRERMAREAGPGGLYGGNAKAVVLGLLQRGGKVKAQVIPERKSRIVQKIVRESVEKNAIVHTDEHVVYRGLDDAYVHEIINHAEAYAKNYITTNGIENFWSLLKRGLGGTYISVEPFHLFRYLDEQVFRYNNRATKDNPLNDSDRFVAALAQVAGKRLTYKQLTGKEGEAAF